MSENGEKFEKGQTNIHGDDRTDWSCTSAMNVNAAKVEKLILGS
jgi:hypothetical protein